MGAINEGDCPDRVIEGVEGIAPANLIGRAAMVLTGEADPEEALKKLLADEALQAQVLADIHKVAPFYKGGDVQSRATDIRYGELRQLALRGKIPIKELNEGEKLRLIYTNRRRKQALLDVIRNDSSKRDGNLTLLIANTSGKSIRNRLTTLKPGMSVFLGYSPKKNIHASDLQLSSSPAWPKKVFAEDGKWYCSGLHENPNFQLEQVYLGFSFDCPLFDIDN